MKDLLIEAIERRLRLSIFYEPGQRVIEPHALGFGSAGQLLLRAFQTEGVSASGEHVHWKLLRVDRIVSCELEGTKFYDPRDGYRENDKAMTRGIVAQILLRKRGL